MTDRQVDNSGNYPVLIVEDNPGVNRMLQQTIENAGHVTACVVDGRKAFAQLEKGYFPIIITDLVIPGMDGLALCRHIRDHFKAHYIYTIVLTASDSPEELLEVLEAGADEYLVKPVSDAELRARLKTARRILELERSLRESLEQFKSLSEKDSLTGFFNRRYLALHLPQEIKRTVRYRRPLSVLMFDFDHFKEINDRFGHQVGDQFLQQCGQCVTESLREDLDWAVRYGGEEFFVVLPETDFEGALVVAERLRQRIAAITVHTSKVEVRVTASFGVAGLKSDSVLRRLPMETLIECADRCLYEAKAQGRNCVQGQQM